ncbi:hypothetical protein C8N35_10383 [Breoghania corrubedonensis]|uniref:Sugar O-methyltransferase n=1 Tax=Breoghania corrubedonensis TaxID=665038 RepID=A0A2T5VAX4_9HYPH|nr:hypothetical protein [Breoghania corrubedonensis]PTW60902.1 hypothetical protein C8N35_10383 [Breoghania corrubedonensis]
MLDRDLIIPTFSEFKETPHDDKVLDKILTFWEACRANRSKGKLYNPWIILVDEKQGELVAALDEGDKVKLLELFSDFWKKEFPAGFAQSRRIYLLQKEKWEKGDHAPCYAWANKIFKVAEAVGALKLQQEGKPLAHQHIKSIHILADMIAEKTGVELGIPDELSGGYYGFPVNGRLVFRREIMSYLFSYQASLVRSGENICEIGPGVGHSAYYHNRFGASHSYLFDLPTVATVAIWYLGRLEGPDAVSVYGETPNAHCKYFIYPHYLFGEKVTDFMKFDTLVNKNSFPEMGEEIASDYFSKSTFYGCKSILSSNYEDYPVAPKVKPDESEKRMGIVADSAVRAGWRCISRSPGWLMTGLVDEIFVAPDSSSPGQAHSFLGGEPATVTSRRALPLLGKLGLFRKRRQES